MLVVAMVANAVLAAPPNDKRSKALIISSLPGGGDQDPGGATSAGDPQPSCQGYGGAVWFKFTPESNATLLATTEGSSYDTVIGVFTKGHNEVGCDDDSGSGYLSSLIFDVTGGTTYYIGVGDCCDRDALLEPGTDSLQLNLSIAL